MVESLRALVVVALLTAACGAGQPAAGRRAPETTTPTPATTAEAVRTEDGCPLTIPPDPGFVPPEPYPPQPPELYQARWYGSADLWTMLHPDGEVWEGLPEHHRGKFTQKVIYWSEDLPEGQLTPIALIGRRLDRPGTFEAHGSGGGGFREDIGKFMMLGIEIPAGCWELTARYGDAELTYVVLVKG